MKSSLCSVCPDYIRGGCQRFCQGAEEQVQDQALLCQASTDGLPTCPDHPGGRQHGKVGLAQTHTNTHTDIHILETLFYDALTILLTWPQFGELQSHIHSSLIENRLAAQIFDCAATICALVQGRSYIHANNCHIIRQSGVYLMLPYTA